MYVSFSFCHDQLQAAVTRAQFMYNMKRIIYVLFIYTYYIYGYVKGVCAFREFSEWLVYSRPVPLHPSNTESVYWNILIYPLQTLIYVCIED